MVETTLVVEATGGRRTGEVNGREEEKNKVGESMQNDDVEDGIYKQYFNDVNVEKVKTTAGHDHDQ